MKRTSDRLATFINKKLTQAATVFEPQQPAPAPCPSMEREAQQGQPLYATMTTTTTSVSEHPARSMDTYHTPPIPPSTLPPTNLTNAALDSPYPPNGDYPPRYEPCDMVTPSASINSSHTSYKAPSPYILPPSTQTHQPQNTPYSHPSPPNSTESIDHHPFYQRKTYSTPEPYTTPHPPKRPFHSYDSLSTSTPTTNLPHPSAIPSFTQLIRRRTTQAKAAFPHANIPLSRAIDVSNEADIDLWRHQLENNNPVAIQPTLVQDLPHGNIFTLSSSDTHLSTTHWTRLKRVLTYLSRHHNPLHLILPAESHTRLLPCATYPVISLSALSTTLSKEANTNPWVFIEEVSGCWGGGVIYGCETRGASVTGIRENIRYVLRAELDVTECMKHCLRNVFFGAVIPESEIVEMAKWTFRKGLAVGANWREVLVNGVGGGLLPSSGVWLDGSRTVDGCWKGGVEGVEVSRCIRVVARDQTFYFVRFGDTESVWVLVGDVGGSVWSKIVCGEGSMELDTGGIENATGKVLYGMVGRVDVVNVAFCDVKEVQGS